MSRLSVAGTDEEGDTVKVEPEHTNQTHEVFINTYINYNIVQSIDIDGMSRTRPYCAHVKKTLCRSIIE
jgi:hypothetical protein